MRISLVQIDKTQENYLAEGVENYIKRLKNYCHFDVHTISVPKPIRQKTVKEQKIEEAKLILNYLTNEDVLVLLDEKGKELSSVGFSQFISQKQNASVKRLIFLIGGPFGFDEKIYTRANSQLSFSKMTFSHQMIRLFFVEQLYRAFTILKGEKYHHD